MKGVSQRPMALSSRWSASQTLEACPWKSLLMKNRNLVL